MEDRNTDRYKFWEHMVKSFLLLLGISGFMLLVLIVFIIAIEV